MKIKKIVIGVVTVCLIGGLGYFGRFWIKDAWEFMFVSAELVDLALKEPEGKIVTPKTTAEMAALFKGVKSDAVPRIYVDRLPDDFYPRTVAHKTLYMKVMTALALRTNEQITRERHALQVLEAKRNAGYRWTRKEMRFFNLMADKYDAAIQRTEAAKMANLLYKVDTIPTSLIVNQAIYFTKWGAQHRESPYGQYYWANNHNYTLQPHASLVDATDSFALELNSLSSLANFHEARQTMGHHKDMYLGVQFSEAIKLYMPEDPNYARKLRETYKTGLIAPLDWAKLVPEKGDK